MTTPICLAFSGNISHVLSHCCWWRLTIAVAVRRCWHGALCRTRRNWNQNMSVLGNYPTDGTSLMRPTNRLVGNVGVALDAVLQLCDEMRHIHTCFVLTLKGERRRSWRFETGYRKLETYMKFWTRHFLKFYLPCVCQTGHFSVQRNDSSYIVYLQKRNILA